MDKQYKLKCVFNKVTNVHALKIWCLQRKKNIMK